MRYNFNKEKRRGSSRIMRIIDAIVFLLTLVFGVTLIAAYLARYISPVDVWAFAFAGLVAPMLFVINISLMLYWAIRWRLFIIIPAFVVLIGIGNISLFFRPTFSKHFGDVMTKQTVVMSFNVMGFLVIDDNGKTFTTIDSVTAFINRQKPDILCLQEFQAKSHKQKTLIDSLIGLRYNKVNYKLKNASGGGWGLAVYSRYPIINSDVLDYPLSSNSSLWVDIVVKSDTVRVFNNHLQTTSVDAPDREYITSSEIMQDLPDRRKRVRGIVAKLKRNYMKRALQADTLAPIIKSSPYDIIVTGDFNDTPMSYVYSTVSDGLADTFVEKGRGMTTNTYNGLFNMFRIDYILHSKRIRTVSYSTPVCEYSDHKPVVAGLEFPD